VNPTGSNVVAGEGKGSQKCDGKDGRKEERSVKELGKIKTHSSEISTVASDSGGSEDTSYTTRTGSTNVGSMSG
jgi:hypothetical protein